MIPAENSDIWSYSYEFFSPLTGSSEKFLIFWFREGLKPPHLPGYALARNIRKLKKNSTGWRVCADPDLPRLPPADGPLEQGQQENSKIENFTVFPLRFSRKMCTPPAMRWPSIPDCGNNMCWTSTRAPRASASPYMTTLLVKNFPKIFYNDLRRFSWGKIKIYVSLKFFHRIFKDIL